MLQAFRLASFNYSQNKQTHPSVSNFLYTDALLGDPCLDGVLNDRLLLFEDETGESCFMRFFTSFAGAPDGLVLGEFSYFFTSFGFFSSVLGFGESFIVSSVGGDTA